MPNPREPRPDFSNVKSGSSSTGAEPRASDREMTYTVQEGDSLSAIAKDRYGETKWKAILEANRDQISNPDLIHPGQVLTIPSLQEEPT